jgi:hypothetical protein
MNRVPSDKERPCFCRRRGGIPRALYKESPHRTRCQTKIRRSLCSAEPACVQQKNQRVFRKQSAYELEQEIFGREISVRKLLSIIVSILPRGAIIRNLAVIHYCQHFTSGGNYKKFSCYPLLSAFYLGGNIIGATAGCMQQSIFLSMKDAVMSGQPTELLKEII